MKKLLITTAALALMCGVASAQTNQGAGSSNSGPANMEKHKATQGSGMSGSGNSGTTGMSGKGSTYPGPSKSDRDLPAGSQSTSPTSPNVRNSR